MSARIQLGWGNNLYQRRRQFLRNIDVRCGSWTAASPSKMEKISGGTGPPCAKIEPPFSKGDHFCGGRGSAVSSGTKVRPFGVRPAKPPGRGGRRPRGVARPVMQAGTAGTRAPTRACHDRIGAPVLRARTMRGRNLDPRARSRRRAGGGASPAAQQEIASRSSARLDLRMTISWTPRCSSVVIFWKQGVLDSARMSAADPFLTAARPSMNVR